MSTVICVCLGMYSIYSFFAKSLRSRKYFHLKVVFVAWSASPSCVRETVFCLNTERSVNEIMSRVD